MEFLRFGSSIPGSYWGCCAVDIIQNFKSDPDDPASIQLVNGDGGTPTSWRGETAFVGLTYREIFWQRLRFGTFDTQDMPNHVFLAILTQEQIDGSVGFKWLEILHEAGFEFLRTTDNSVYSGDEFVDYFDETVEGGQNPNHIFGLFRNIGEGAVRNPFQPPKEWLKIGKPAPSLLTSDKVGEELAEEMFLDQRNRWHELPAAKFYTEQDIENANVRVTYAGIRSKFPQESKEQREEKTAKEEQSAFPKTKAYAA